MDPQQNQTNPSVHNYTLVLAIINLVIGAIGLPLAALILWATMPLLRKSAPTSIRLVAIVIVMDIICCVVFIINSILLLINPDYLTQYPLACDLSYFFNGIPVFSSIWFVAMVAMERYFHVVLERGVSRRVWYAVMAASLGFLVATGVYGAAANATAVGSLGAYCFMSPVSPGGLYIIFAICFVNWVCIAIMIFSYVSISVVTLRIKQNINENQLDPKGRSRMLLNRAFWKLMTVLIFYLITNSYETYLELHDFITKEERTHMEDLVSAALQNFNPIVNSLILLAIHPVVWEGFWRTLGFKK